MENLVCPKCKQNYDFELKLPRLFPNCGHTFCSHCIKKMLNKKKKILKCPKDNIKCDSQLAEKGLDYFPINFAIKNLMKPDMNSDSSELSDIENDFSHSEKNNSDDQVKKSVSLKQENCELNFCIHHQKKAELICLTDRKVICSECVMFGVHKNHEYLKPDYFKQRAQKDLYDLREKAESLNPSQLSDQLVEQEKAHLIGKVKFKKDLLIKEIEKNFKSVREALEQKEKEVLDEMNNHFLKFENSINYISSNLTQILQEEKDLQQKFALLETELQKQSPDFTKLLAELYGEHNLLKTSQEISTKRNQQSVNTKKLIYENLNKIKMNGNFKKIVDEIRIDINLDTQAQQEQKKSFVERTQSFKAQGRVIRRNSLDDNLYNDIQPLQKQEVIGIKKQDSIISDIIKQDSDDISLNVDDEMEGSNILGNSMQSPIPIQKALNNINDSKNQFKEIGSVKNFKRLSQMVKQPSYQHPNKRFSKQIEARNSQTKTRQSRDFGNEPFLQNNLAYFNPDPASNNQSNFMQQSIFIQNESNHSKLTQKQFRSQTPVYSKFGYQSQRNFYQPQSYKTIKRNLSKKGISENDLDIYLKEIMKDQEIKILDLSFNSISTKGFKLLIQKLSEHRSIEFIDLRNNLIDDKAIIILEKFGKKLKTVNRINLSKNKLTNSLSKKQIFLDKLKKRGVKIHLIL